MSSMRRESGEASLNEIVRRMVSLPRNILGRFSRVVDQGMDLIEGGRTRIRNQNPPPNFTQFQQNPSSFPMVQEEWAFLYTFEQQYGTFSHPFFYACRFSEAMKIAQDEHKFLFLYLHSPENPFTQSFCRETLCSDLIVQFLDANFVSWGAIANTGEGLQMATTLQVSSFPFCAVVAPASGDNNMAVLRQMEGPVSPAELVEILQRTLEEQGLAFGSGWAKEEEKRRADRRLKEEQDTAYLAALQIDKGKGKLKNLTPEERVQRHVEASNKINYEKKPKQNPMGNQHGKVKEAATSRETQQKDGENRGKDGQVTQILIRFPNGERREKSFFSTDKVQAIYRFIDTLGLPGVGNYRLISSFPRKVYGVDQMGVTLKDAGLHPRASLFLELL